MTNLWDLIEQIRDPDSWRERKVVDLRRQWGYNATPIKNQGDGSSSAPIYSDSLPLDYQAPRPLSMLYNTLDNFYRKNDKEFNQMKGSPGWFPERYDLKKGMESIRNNEDFLMKRPL